MINIWGVFVNNFIFKTLRFDKTSTRDTLVVAIALTIFIYLVALLISNIDLIDLDALDLLEDFAFDPA